MDQSTSIIFFLAAVFVFGGILLAVILLSKRGPKTLDVDKYRSRWMTIEGQLKRDEPNSFQVTIIQADSLLDQALRERGLAGKSMGERMKMRKGKWSHENDLWNAHKLRNRIAHETNVKLDYETTRRALSAFKQGLKDIGAI